jgi:hypothetical protein
MTEPDNFLSRWARRKREAKTSSDAGSRNAGPKPTVPPPAEAEAEPDLDLESLPSVDSITATTDISSFLTSRVPAELTRAALRQAWSTDPAIRDFIGIAENQWDFNDPDAIPGFGVLGDTDDVPTLLAQALGRVERAADAIPGLAIPPLPTPAAVIACRDELPKQPLGADPASAEPTLSARDPADHDAAAAMPNSVTTGNGDTQPANRRLHGSALPR